MVWLPLSSHLKPGIKTLYLATDGDLARFPFVVLPGKAENKILLEEDLLIGYVPHGPFLLEQLKSPPPAPMPNDPLFILANVSYGKTGKKRESLSP